MSPFVRLLLFHVQIFFFGILCLTYAYLGHMISCWTVLASIFFWQSDCVLFFSSFNSFIYNRKNNHSYTHNPIRSISIIRFIRCDCYWRAIILHWNASVSFFLALFLVFRQLFFSFVQLFSRSCQHFKAFLWLCAHFHLIIGISERGMSFKWKIEIE